jgi:hypothetical protein
MSQLICYPDAHPEGTTVDSHLTNDNADWATNRGAAASSYAPAPSNATIYIEAYTGYTIARSILLFDTNTVPADATVDSATLELYKNATAVSNGDTSACCLVASTPASNTDIVAGDFDQLGTTRLGTDVLYSAIGTGAYFTLNLNAAGLAAITKAGITKLGIRDKRDLDNSAPTGVNSIAMDSADGTNKPRLTINYTPASGGGGGGGSYRNLLGVGL